MTVFKILLIFVETVCALLLIGVILLQKSKGEGLGLAFGAEMGESIFGARASNVLVKITIWLGAIFILNTVILAMMYSNISRRSLLESKGRPPIEQPAMPLTPTAPISPTPAAPSAGLPSPSPAPQGGVPQLPSAPAAQ